VTEALRALYAHVRAARGEAAAPAKEEAGGWEP